MGRSTGIAAAGVPHRGDAEALVARVEVEQEVLELDVAVDQLPPMAIGHAQKHLPEECARTRLRQATVVDHLAEELTLQTTANRACSASAALGRRR